jgi:hypothetical protein
MKLRSTLGALTVAGALTLGAAAPALASEPADPPSRACVAARHALADLRVVNRHVNREIHRLEVAIQRATDQSHPGLAAELQERLDRLEARQDRVQARVATLRERITDHCAPADEPTS